MTKKSKTKSKVTATSASALNTSPTKDTTEDKQEAAQLDSNCDSVKKSNDVGLPIPVINNGKISSPSPLPNPTAGYNSNSLNFNHVTATPSLASIPGIVDNFLAPQLSETLNLKGDDKKAPEAKGKKEKSHNANNKDSKKESSDTLHPQLESQPPPSEKKNKRKKSKPVKNTKNNGDKNVGYDNEDVDGRELDVFNSGGASFNGNGNGSSYPTSFQHHLKAGLTSRDVTSLAHLERIRNTAAAFRNEGNNIVLLPGEDDHGRDANNGSGAQYPTQSCYDDYDPVHMHLRPSYHYDADDDLLGAEGGGPGSVSVPSDETSILGYDNDEDDDDEREGSWSLTHQTDYGYPSSKQQASIASSSVASSESENNISSLSTTISGGSGSGGSTLTSFSSKGFPSLAACTSIWDGANNPCEIKDCSNPATKKCNQCKEAFYCGEDHQRLDWKRHKNNCVPYRMKRFQNDVHCAVATRNIPQGQTIFRDKPMFVIPIADPENDFLNVMDLPCVMERLHKDGDPNCLGEEGIVVEKIVACNANKPACFGCLKSVEFIGPPRYNCARCGLPLCSYKCHLDIFHQTAECHAINQLGGYEENQHSCYHSLYMDIEIIRALQLQIGNLDTTQWDRFMSLKQNVRVEWYKSSYRYKRFLESYRELVPISAKMSGYNVDLIGNVHAIITALSFRPSLKSTFKLIFPTQVLFAHECIPNTFHYLEESQNGIANRVTLVTKAATSIMKKDVISIDFCPTPFLYYPLRRMILKNVLCIDNCTCERCKKPSSIGDHTSDIKCPCCDHGLISPEKAVKWQNSVWACTTCLEELPYQKVVEITTDCREELANILLQPRPYIVPHIQQFINKRERELNEAHSIILQAWSLIEAHLRPNLTATRLSGPAPRYPESTIEEYRTLGRSCEAIMKHLDIIRPGICYERGCLYFNQYYIEIACAAKKYHLRLTRRKEYISELMQSMKKLQEALKIFQMYEGYNRDVALHIQETTSALVTTKSFIQELLLTDNEENKNKKFKTANLNNVTNSVTSMN